jgi:epoxide hydrolase
MLTNVMIYWLFGTAGSSARYYKEGVAQWGKPDPISTVPTAITVMPHDIGSPVRRIAEQSNRIIRWTELPRGGHFAAMEEPDLIVEELRGAARSFRRTAQSTAVSG